VPVAITEPLVELSAGQLHNCARAFSDTVHCWGANASGQLGDGTFRAHDRPQPLIL
jgi:alpha-tubulin suppressor-like RCC1 family protein